MATGSDKEERQRVLFENHAQSYELVYIRFSDSNLGKLAPEHVTRKEVIEWLDTHGDVSYNRSRSRLLMLFNHMIADGLIPSDNNIIEKIIPKDETKERERLTIEQYQVIHTLSPAWLQNAMDLSLISLQRREDIAAMKFDQIITQNIRRFRNQANQNR